MKKIPCLFERIFHSPRHAELLRTVTPGCEWALTDEALATRKYDGSACLVRDGLLFKRYDAKRGKTPPPGFEPCGEPDEVTGHHPGWVPVDNGPEDRWHREAWVAQGAPRADGTYELVGPRVNGNHEGRVEHALVLHGSEVVEFAPVTWDAIRAFLALTPIEGVVFHHRDGGGRMAKIRRRDFGLPWPAQKGGTLP